jgi:hypothetical protein
MRHDGTAPRARLSHLTAYSFKYISMVMLTVLTTDDFAAWFDALDDGTAEDVATALEVIERLGPERAAPGTSEYLLWYEHPRLQHHIPAGIDIKLHAWGAFYAYARRVLDQLESKRFMARLALLPTDDAQSVLHAVQRIRSVAVPRARWLARPEEKLEDGRAEVRRWYFAALAAAGFDVVDLPAYTNALNEIALRTRPPGFRLIYGVDTERAIAIVCVGDRLDRSFYGDSVKRAEAMWRSYRDGTLEPTALETR